MIENDATMRPRLSRSSGGATVPSEAWDRTHPDHDHWVGGRGWCYDVECLPHSYGPDGEDEEPATRSVGNEDQSLRIPGAETPNRSRCVTGDL